MECSPFIAFVCAMYVKGVEYSPFSAFLNNYNYSYIEEYLRGFFRVTDKIQFIYKPDLQYQRA